MTLLYIKKYTRAYIQAHPNWTFVFGDNLLRRGLKGQAFSARGEPNAVGIATKRAPRMSPDAYLKDIDFNEWYGKQSWSFEYLLKLSHSGKTIIWPLDGIGTGLAQLEKKAPLIWYSIEDLRMALE